LDLSNFTDRKTGKIVEVSGVRETSHAFIPDPLPPQWEWQNDLWHVLLRAKEELARLDGIGRHLPNPQLLLTPLQRREAQRSSSLEGTFATPQQLLLFEINPSEVETKGERTQPVREVVNYSRALRVREEIKEQLPISLRLIRELHRILLDGVRGAQAEPGEFRRGQVQIGSDGRYIPPPANYMMACLDEFERYLHMQKKFDPLVEAFIAHYQFEAIHPFRDGNGRVGRLLLAITIEDWCELSGQWLYMSPYFEKHKDEYIDRLFKISTTGDWAGWLKFCLQGVTYQALDAQKRCSRLLELKEEYRNRLEGSDSPGRIYQIVDDLFVRPFTTAPWIKEKFKKTYPTARADLERLVDLGILSDIEMRLRRQKAYLCQDIFRITYEEIEQLD
jgi:Fic family protein